MPDLQKADNRIYLNGVEYSHPDHVQFIRDMKAKEITVRLRFRQFYGGPSVELSKKESASNITSVACGYEATKYGFLIFPQVSDPIVKAIAKQNGL